jgi:hypothetical protein
MLSSSNPEPYVLYLTPADAKTLGSLLERTPSCKELHVTDIMISPSIAAAAALLPALRNTAISTVHFKSSRMTEAQLVALCASDVDRPIVVRLEDCSLKGRMARAREVLQESGCDVTLECDGVFDDAAMEAFMQELGDAISEREFPVLVEGLEHLLLQHTATVL